MQSALPKYTMNSSECTENNSSWLLTLADLLSLILTFFVLTYSMSSLEEPIWEKVRKSLTQQLSPNYVDMPDSKPSEKTFQYIDSKEALNLDYLYAILSTKIHNETALKEIRLARYPDRIIISLPSSTMFAVGKSKLSLQAISIMFLLGEMLYSVKNRIDVHGHTDPLKISGKGTYPSNWELSLARALTVAHELKESGYAYPIPMFGYADSRFTYKDKTKDDQEKEKQYSLARRVDIIIREMQ